ncbi:MAG: hypothetical protein QXT02_06375 [Candidatus Hadarchaeum sp.]|uniref:hypothetical protein n=1 Tax=Candidatus Hadarchaeum sp. TaxID=2883567 RepID=UPI0031806558
MVKKVPLVALVPRELKTALELAILEKHGVVGNKISPTVEAIIREWIEKNRGVIANEEHG